MSAKKRFFSKHAKSSAALISLGIHAVLLVVALSFVAVTVITREDVDFEAKTVARPNMQLKKLQVPVNIKKPPQQPKLRQRIVATPTIKNSVPDIKMPEIAGVKGGLGGSGGGLGGAVALGFSMPEIEFFGVKGKSERIMLILDGGQYMASDELGGAYGFEVIKNECLKLIEGLPPTAVFNIVVYGGPRQLFPEMVSASPANVQKAKEWLLPLNKAIGAQTKYGVGTLGPGGSTPKNEYPFGKFKQEVFEPRGWNEPVLLAMKQQADSVFLLTHAWGFFGYTLDDVGELRRKWNETSAGKNWAEKVAEGRKALDEENKQRKAAGDPPSALNRNSEMDIVRKYAPGTTEPPAGERVYLGVADLVSAFKEAYQAYAKDTPKLGIKKSSRAEFSLNVIFFRPEKFNDENHERYVTDHATNFEALAKGLNGEFRSIAGLKAIESYVK